jgi:transposase InsO family protein
VTEPPTIPSVEEIAEAARKETGPHTRNIVWEDNVPRWSKTNRLYVPMVYRPLVLWWFHASRIGGHMGTNRLIKRLQRYFSWPNLAEDANTFVKQCILCSCLRSYPKSKGQPEALRANGIFDMVSLDFIGPVKMSQGKTYYIHVAIDHYSRFMAVNIEEQTPTALSAREFVQRQWLPYFGVPRAILTDRGCQYVAGEFREWVTQTLGTQLIHTSPYYPQGNGINESSHVALNHAIKTATAGSYCLEFRDIVQAAVLVHNSSPHAKLGDTPFGVVFGKDMILPGLCQHSHEVTEYTRHTVRYERYMREALKEHLTSLDIPSVSDVRGDEFRVGDIVTYPLSPLEKDQLSHQSGVQKWSPQWSLPHRVMAIHDKQVNVKPLWTNNRQRAVPLSQLRKLLTESPKALLDLIPSVLKTRLKPSTEVTVENPLTPVRLDAKSLFKDEAITQPGSAKRRRLADN